MATKEQGKWRRELEDKWSRQTLQHNYTVLPTLLFTYASELHKGSRRDEPISPAQQAVLFHLLTYWWFADNPPVVSKARLAESLGISARQVQRHLRALEEAGLIETRFPNRPGRNPNEYTFNGLIGKLEKMAEAHGKRKKREIYERSREVKSMS